VELSLGSRCEELVVVAVVEEEEKLEWLILKLRSNLLHLLDRR